LTEPSVVASLAEVQPPTRYLIHEWIDGCVVFDLDTGDTHALDATMAKHFRARHEGGADEAAMPDSAHALLAQMDLLG
jgi:hypothetical protein